MKDTAIFSVKAAGALAASFWLSMSATVHVLLFMMLIDYITGLVAAFREKCWDSSIAWSGLGKKFVVLLLVVTGSMLQKSSGLNLPVDLGEAVAFFYVFQELVSVLENAIRCGVPVPDVLVSALAKVKPKAATTQEVQALESSVASLEASQEKFAAKTEKLAGEQRAAADKTAASHEEGK